MPGLTTARHSHFPSPTRVRHFNVGESLLPRRRGLARAACLAKAKAGGNPSARRVRGLCQSRHLNPYPKHPSAVPIFSRIGFSRYRILLGDQKCSAPTRQAAPCASSEAFATLRGTSSEYVVGIEHRSCVDEYSPSR